LNVKANREIISTILSFRDPTVLPAREALASIKAALTFFEQWAAGTPQQWSAFCSMGTKL
jgi:hypothetical protein